MTSVRSASVVCLSLLFVVVSSGQQSPPRKWILSVGESGYRFLPPITASTTDAKVVADAFEKIGFNATEKEDLDHASLKSVIEKQFVPALQPGDTAVIYFSGYGVQVDGDNYLLPSSYDPANKDEIDGQAYSVTRLLGLLQKRKIGVTVVILDACRTLPSPDLHASRAGLALMNTEPGIVLALSSRPGTSIPQDGSVKAAQGGYYAREIANAIQTPGLTPAQIFQMVSDKVREDSKGAQVPLAVPNLPADIYLVPSKPVSEVRPLEATPEKTSVAGDEIIDRAREAVFSSGETLPNYMARQYTTRYAAGAARAGKPSWQVLDNVTADVTEENGTEKYQNILVNGKPPRENVQASGSWSSGEFSSLLREVMSPSTAADFHGKRDTTIVNRAAFRYDYSVQQPNSHWKVEAGGQTWSPAYTGSIWIDKETARVLRIELAAQSMPRGFPLDTVESAVDYDFVPIGDGKFLLPVHSEAQSCARGAGNCTRNVIEFRDYRVHGADEPLVEATSVATLKEPSIEPVNPSPPTPVTTPHHYYYLDPSNGAAEMLESVRQKLHVSAKALGYGGATASYELEGARAMVRLKPGRPQEFLVNRSSTGAGVPDETFGELYTLSLNSKGRMVTLGVAGPFGAKRPGLPPIPVRIAAYGPGLLKIVPASPLPPGEYAFIVAGNWGDTRPGDKNGELFCFGVDAD